MANTTYLNLTNKLLRRLNEVEIASANFASVKGVQALAKDAINAAIFSINQQQFEWPFNEASGSQVLTVGTYQYSWPADLKIDRRQSFYIDYDNTLNVQSTPLKPISRNLWETNLRQNDIDNGTSGVGTPIYVCPGVGFTYIVSPSPDKAYTVKFSYYKNTTALDLYTDTSLIPSNFDDTIVQGALYHFYMFRDNLGQANAAEQMFTNMVREMKRILVGETDTMSSMMIAKAPSYAVRADDGTI